MGKGFEYRHNLFLELCHITGTPRPEVLRQSFPGDPCDITDGDLGGEVRLNVEAARDSDPDWHVAHVFGHWLADLHSGNNYAKSDTVADVIAELVLAFRKGEKT